MNLDQSVKPGNQELATWSMFLHLSQILVYVVPVVGIVVPVVIWQIKKKDLPEIDVHGKIVTNWLISILVMYLICFVLAFVVIGLFGFFVLPIVHTVFAVIGGIKANNHEAWPYPATFIKVF